LKVCFPETLPPFSLFENKVCHWKLNLSLYLKPVLVVRAQEMSTETKKLICESSVVHVSLICTYCTATAVAGLVALGLGDSSGQTETCWLCKMTGWWSLQGAPLAFSLSSALGSG
jgi:hypothetical protein